ncbi:MULTISPECIES: hypothetical protein [Actinomadura]|uniref:Uncharacterized protein n=1 Tax=Actinomadura yumaensis TaxID=111807 RepID=A0ABW2CCI5_9ACTN|nr:hypothetical protein [Actinomadura sp. J1-007]MWK35537.1 hypothetical protein [Actinomadura sp. J1-007]
MIATPEGVRDEHVVVPMPPAGVARLSFDNGLSRLALRAGELPHLLEATFAEPLPIVWAVDAKTHIEYPLGARLLPRTRTSRVHLNPSLPWSVDVHGAAEGLDADLTGVDLCSLAFHAGLARAAIALGRPRGTRTVRLASVDGLRLVRPRGVPVRVRTGESRLLDETPGYDAAADRYLVIVSGGASGLVLA